LQNNFLLYNFLGATGFVRRRQSGRKMWGSEKNLPRKEKIWLTYGAEIGYNIARIVSERIFAPFSKSADHSPLGAVVGPGEPA